MTSRAISDYALLSDCSSAALVSGEGSIDWLCLPRFDSPSVFARILDDDAGHWSITPAGEHDVRRQYLDGTLVLETQFTSASGMAMVTDALLFADGTRGHDIGDHTPHVLVRDIEVTEGEMAFVGELAPRPEYGIVRPRLHLVDGAVVSVGGSSLLVVSGPPPTELGAGVARWRLDLREGSHTTFALNLQRRGAPKLTVWSQRKASKRLSDTVDGWRSWSELHDRYDGPAHGLVRHSGRVLHALTYKPTGAIIAAPTTSLAERAGATRNWDYRYAWIRDTRPTLEALGVVACQEEAERFVRFLIETTGTAHRQDHGVQAMYGVGGEHDLTERELDHLDGWRDSRPVRVGNGAWGRGQIGAFGELLDAVDQAHEGLSPSAETCEFLAGIADAAAVAWREPDAGMWESRGHARHYVHSKVMCWVALDRASKLAEWLGAPGKALGWRAEADVIRAEVLERGWSEELGCFTQAFDSNDLDASALLLAITGFLPVDDPRMVATIERISIDLAAPCGLLYRYRSDDGIEGGEGVFLLCTFWLVQCRAALGQREHAIDLFERATAYANDVGLLSEEAEPFTGELVGNFPQALSHVGLVNAAWALSQPPR